MRILLSIKAILNYLYNHLIDLVWTKKIRFADGSEMTTASSGGFSLYDIKLMSQAVADKGFAFMCHTTRRDLAKSLVPTLYNDIMKKYDSVDMETSGFQNLSGGAFGYNCGGFHGDYFYCIRQENNWKLYKTHKNNLSSPIWEQISNEELVFVVNGEFNFVITNNYIALMGSEYNNVYNMWGVHLKLIDFDGNLLYDYFYQINGDGNYALSLVEDTDGQYLYISVGKRDSGIFNLSRIKVGNTINIEHITNTQTYITNITKNRNYYFFIYANRTDDSSLARTTNWQNIEILARCGGSYGIIGDVIRTERSNTSAKISYDYGETWQDVDWNSTNYYRLTKFNGIDKYICHNGNNDLYTTTDLINFTLLANNIPYHENFAFNDNNSFIVAMQDYDFMFSGMIKKQYTDTYTINGNTVAINYNKYNDFKICISDGGTNDTNLETVFNYLGYLNYWLLDTVNETVAIQRDKNTYSLMFVGDNFIDDYEDLPTNDYSMVMLKKQVESYVANAISSAPAKKTCITSYALNHLSSKTKNNSYQADEDTLIIIGRTSFSDDFSWSLQVSTDNNNWTTVLDHTISSGDPGNAILQYAIIEKGLYYKATGSGIQVYNSAPLRA